MSEPRPVLLANPGADLYGSDRMLVETVKALVESGRPVVVTVPEDGPLTALLTQAGARIEVLPTPIIRKSALSPRGLVGLIGEAIAALGPSWRLLRQLRPSHLIVNTITPPLWLPLARLAGIHTSCHVHEAEESVNPVLRSALYVPLLFTNRIIINSRYALGILRTAAPWLAKRVLVVYNSVPGPAETVPPRAELERPAELLFVGRLSERKGPQVAIRAMARLRDLQQDVRLSLLGAVFRGNEAFEEQLRAEVAELRIDDRVDFLGFRDSVWPEFAAADIVVIPSVKDEPFGNTAVEASLAARPLVVSATSGLKEASHYAEAAIRVAPDEPDEIADAVVRILANWDQYRNDAIADAERVADRFSFERYAAGIVQALELDHG